MMKRALLVMMTSLGALGALAAQDPKSDPKADPKQEGKVDKGHELHVRPFADIWKDIEAKQKEMKSFKAAIAVAVSDNVADATYWYKGEVFVKREEKLPAKLFWKIGTERRAGEEVKLEITQLSVHDGAAVTITDESDPKDKRYKRETFTEEPKFLPQQLLLTGGRDLENTFVVRTLMDPKLIKTERTISKHLDDRLENKEGVDPTKAAPDAVNRVDFYVFELTPKAEDLKRQLQRVVLQLDSQTMLPLTIAADYADGNRITVTVSGVSKVEAKDVPDTMFTLDLTNYKKLDE